MFSCILLRIQVPCLTYNKTVGLRNSYFMANLTTRRDTLWSARLTKAGIGDKQRITLCSIWASARRTLAHSGSKSTVQCMTTLNGTRATTVTRRCVCANCANRRMTFNWRQWRTMSSSRSQCKRTTTNWAQCLKLKFIRQALRSIGLESKLNEWMRDRDNEWNQKYVKRCFVVYLCWRWLNKQRVYEVMNYIKI